MEKSDIMSFDMDEICSEMAKIGEKSFRAKQIYEWIYKKNAKSFDAMRSNYRERRELSSLHLLNVEDKFKEQLSLLGFSVD